MLSLNMHHYFSCHKYASRNMQLEMDNFYSLLDELFECGSLQKEKPNTKKLCQSIQPILLVEKAHFTLLFV